MAIRTWTLSAGGSFGSGPGWTGGVQPVAGDTADITDVFAGAAYSVQVTDAEAAAVVNVGAANAELAVESGGVLTTGAIDVTDGTLAVLSGGEITGGPTITFAPAAQFSAIDGTIDGATWRGTLGLLGVSQASLVTVTTSLNVLNEAGTGPGEIDITGPGATMNVESSMTLDGIGGNLAINIGTASASDEFLDVGSADVLTFGSDVSVNQTAANSNVSFSDVSTGGTLVNQGTMSFTAGAGASAEIDTDTVVNAGTIIESGGVPNGESLDITAQTAFTDKAQGQISIGDFGRVGISGEIDIDGTIGITRTSTLDLNSNAMGSGDILLSNVSTADIFNYSGSVVFLDATGDLALEQPLNYTGTVVGLSRINSATKDVIDLLLTQVTTIQPYTGDTSGGTLTVMDNSSTVATINLLGNYVGQTFGHATDSAGTGTNIFLAPACFAAGTHIATPAGDVAVEGLRQSMDVTTATGDIEKIVWLGHRHIDCVRHPEPARVWPVRIQAGAFGDGSPRRDLFLSPDHAVFVDGALIPIKALINGTSIAQTPVAEITYYHVELPRHDLLLAEGLTVESYLNSGDRSDFAAVGDVIRLFPDFSARPPRNAALWETSGRASLVVTGPKLDAARRSINARAPGRRAAP